MRTTVRRCMLLAAWLIPATALGEPIVSAVTGSVRHEGTAAITGSGFGGKTPAAPLRYDDFHDGTAGSHLKEEAVGGWRQDTQPVVYSTTKTRGLGTMSALQDFRDTYTRYIGLTSASMGSGSRRVYVSGWYNMEQGGNASRNVKYCSFTIKGDYNPYGLNSRVDVYPNQGNGHIYSSRNCNGTSTCYAGEWCNNYFSLEKVHRPDGRWHRFERYIDLGTPRRADGYSYVALDLETAQTISGGVFTSSDCGIDSLLIGHYFAKDQVGTPRPWATRYWSELYVDTTLARVEIGDRPVFEDCTHREIQVPTDWSDGKIRFQVNQGTFADGDAGYVFVVDEDDNASEGYPVVFGGDVEPGCLDGSCNGGKEDDCDREHDLSSDRHNCGSCGYACGLDEVCSGGECRSTCDAGLTDCVGSCVDLDASNLHCGACGHACATGRVCANGQCALDCGPGSKEMDGTCVIAAAGGCTWEAGRPANELAAVGCATGLVALLCARRRVTDRTGRDET